MPKVELRDEKKVKDLEERIRRALRMIEAEGTSIAEAAGVLGISRTNLRDRRNGAKACTFAQVDEQLLSPADEKATVR